MKPALKQAMCTASDTMKKHPKKNTALALARDKYGDTTAPLSPTAVCWCALGHLAKELRLDAKSTNDVRLQLAREYDISLFELRRIMNLNDNEGPKAAARRMRELCREP